MDSGHLHLRDFFEPAAHGGIHRFATHRALLLFSGALAVFRERLLEERGPTDARRFLTQLGCAWGWESADATERYVPWSSRARWIDARPTMQAFVGFGSPVAEPSGPGDALHWRHSFEADAHLRQHGHSDAPVCWMLAGFASGYLSRCTGGRLTYREEACVAMGDDICRLVPSDSVDSQDDVTTLCARVLDQLRERLPSVPPAQASPPETTAAAAAQALGVYSPAMRRVMELATRVAPVDSTILITGESGVGKERLAQYIHQQSRRRGGPFVAINCGALSETLLESELFGHTKGAFTGAYLERPGLFEAANGGTMFLDEIGEMPATMQVKLLRVLQEREVRRVGENKARHIDVRLVVATNRRLEQEVTAKRFRHDLYYRLRVVELHVPPLRERPDDMRALAHVLLDHAVRTVPCEVTGFTPRALDALLRYHWPGNVRELENAIERACALADGPLIDVGDLPSYVRSGKGSEAPATVRPLADVEREYILDVLAQNRGNKTQTAEQLRIGIATLHRKLRQTQRRRRPSHSF